MKVVLTRGVRALFGSSRYDQNPASLWICWDEVGKVLKGQAKEKYVPRAGERLSICCASKGLGLIPSTHMVIYNRLSLQF